MAFFSDPPVRLQPYFGHRTENRLVLRARALKADHAGFEKAGRWQAFRTLAAQYASREVAGLPVELVCQGPASENLCIQAVTDREGFAEFALDYPTPRELPRQTSWEPVQLRWSNRHGEQSIDAHILAPGRDVQLGVISDVDDTIIETGITGGLMSVLRNWRRLLAQLPEERIAVPGSDAFYASLGGAAINASSAGTEGAILPATSRPFFYVSSSPWNLYSYLVAFKQAKGLPLGPLFLRDWGFNEQTLGKSSHRAHKQEAIAAIIETHRQLRFALVGDDTQGDLPAFAGIAEQFPGRIAAIFIRSAGEALSAEEEAAKASIEGLGVPLWMGPSYSVGREFLQAAGFAVNDPTAQIVDAVEAADESA